MKNKGDAKSLLSVVLMVIFVFGTGLAVAFAAPDVNLTSEGKVPGGPFDYLQQQIDNIQSTPGPQGVQGKLGPKGDPGVDGTQGVQGKIGPQGDTGSQGVQGKIGPAGADSTVPGSQGVQGKIGPAGADSAVPGPQGVQGKIGPAGADSTVPGPQGVQGKIGPAGADSAGGAQGVQGKIGPQGEPGPAGGTVAYAIGDTGPAGGIVFYVTADGLHGLEAAPEDQTGESGLIVLLAEWGSYGVDIPGMSATAVGSGAVNTKAHIRGCDEADTAAELVYYYSLNGIADWFLPSKDELNLLYLQKDVVGGFANDYYWSSSKTTIYHAWLQAFGDGYQAPGDRSFEHRVRAVRAF